MTTKQLLTLGLAALFAGACGDDAVGSLPADGGGSDPDAGPTFLFPIEGIAPVWEPCSLFEGEADGRAECTTVALPLRWEQSDGRTFAVRAKRLLVAEGSAEVALWLLDGGPGAAGTYDYPKFMERLRARNPRVDLYTLDHRGTGYSGRLGCPEQEAPTSSRGETITPAEMSACLDSLQRERGEELGAMTTSQSAIDVAALVEATRRPGQKVYVRGSSYGSYLAQRYLQIFPAQADGVILEGIFPADGTMIDFDEHTNGVAQAVMEQCGQDPFCASKLGTDPWGKLGDVLDHMAAGYCTGFGVSRDLVRVLFAYLLYTRSLVPLVPAATYRLDRCAPADRAAIVALSEFLFGAGGVWDIRAYSILLQHHVSFSEMWEHPDFAEVDLDAYFADLYDRAFVLKNLGPAKLALRQTWPCYRDSRWDDGWAVSNTPLLMMQGRLDPATPYVKAVTLADHFTAPHQRFVTFPTATHGITGSTPLPDGSDCGEALLFAFMADPTAPLDASCAEEVVPIDFRGSADLAAAALGTTDLWDDGPGG